MRIRTIRETTLIIRCITPPFRFQLNTTIRRTLLWTLRTTAAVYPSQREGLVGIKQPPGATYSQAGREPLTFCRKITEHVMSHRRPREGGPRGSRPCRSSGLLGGPRGTCCWLVGHKRQRTVQAEPRCREKKQSGLLQHNAPIRYGQQLRWLLAAFCLLCPAPRKDPKNPP